MEQVNQIIDPLSLATIHTIKTQRMKWKNLPKNPGAEIFFKDYSSESHKSKKKLYEWLPPGWVVQERVMPSGRVYRYYYDPSGFMYPKKHIAKSAYKDMETREVEDNPPPSLDSGEKGKAPMVD
ncbi:hypothetical protein ACLB2K_071584 [Fragaria x ananassa]